MPDYRLRRHQGKFVVVWWDGKRRFRRSLRTSDADEAKRTFAEYVSLAQRSKKPTVGELFQDYAAHKKRERITYAWKSLAPHFAHFAPKHITEQTCKDYAAARAKAGVATGTIHTELLFLAAALNHAEKRDQLANAPYIWKPKKPRPRDKRISRGEAKLLVEAAHISPHVQNSIILMLGTAGRIGAILDLTWNRVDFDKGLIHLDNPARDETDKKRATVPMNKMVRDALMEAKQGAITDHVIEWAGKPVKSIKKGFRRACERAGLEDVTPHVLRHSAATWMAESGVPMPEIAAYLGHTNIATTYKNYLKFSPSHLRKASEALEL